MLKLSLKAWICRNSSSFKLILKVMFLLYLVHPSRFSEYYSINWKNKSNSSLPTFEELLEHVAASETSWSDLFDPRSSLSMMCSRSARHDPDTVIIIPYRDRKDHLTTILQYLYHLLQMQGVRSRIVVVEQEANSLFNRGKLFNIGYQEFAAVHPTVLCMILHDVDLLPDPQVPYACQQHPTHMSSNLASFRYLLPYKELVGGVLAIRPEQYTAVNGFSNRFFGWGGEDDDLYYRLDHHGIPVVRREPAFSIYRTMAHEKQTPSPDRLTKLAQSKNMLSEGLSDMNYMVTSIQHHPCFTHILVEA